MRNSSCPAGSARRSGRSKAVGGTPIFIKEAEGCLITDVDGNEYIDYVGSYGPMIAGHANERVVAALSKAIGRGTSFGAPTEAETQLAQMIARRPAGDRDGAVRQQRHRSDDERDPPGPGGDRARPDRQMHRLLSRPRRRLLVQAGSGALTLGTPSSPGVPESITADTLLVHVQRSGMRRRQLFEKYPGADRLLHRRAGRGEHGRGPAGRRVSAGPARPVRRSTARCCSSTK